MSGERNKVMKKIKRFIEEIIRLLKDDNNESFKYSLNHCHTMGLFSLVVNGSSGNLTRIFIAQERIAPLDVQLHNHKYGLTLVPVYGKIRHHEAIFADTGLKMDRYSFTSAIDNTFDLKFIDSVTVSLRDYYLPLGSFVEMNHHQIHTVSCKKGAIWIVQENGLKKDETTLLGKPFVMNSMLYRKASEFEIETMRLQVLKRLESFLFDY